ncbi:MAG: radical SAM protein [Patescibacteria group bacterium]|jgi:radical SAM superfamily enzyme YgiQ (UPF0313 family)
MKKILIINPPRFKGKNVRRDERSADILESEVSPFYQGAVLAQYLRENNNFEAVVLDANGFDYDFSQIQKFVEENKGADLAVIKAADDTLFHDVKAAKICRERGITTMLWEPVLSPAEPEKVLRIINKNSQAVDYLILGEAELTVSDFIKNGEAALGIAYFKNDQLIINRREEKDRLDDLNKLPIPSFNDLPVKNYKSWFGAKPWMTLFTSRGCSGNCNYCLIGGSTVFRGYGKKIRLMSAERVLREAKILINDYGVKHITFWDDCFTLDRQRVIDFCELIKKEKIIFKWSCMARVDTVDDELLLKMREAGLTRIGFGIESGSQKILDSIPKRVTVAQNYQAVKLAKKHGLWVFIYIIVGLPEEDWQSVKETIKFIKKSKPNFLFLGCSTAFPGTINFDNCLRNKLLKVDISRAIMENKIITGSKSSAASKYMSVEEIEEAKFKIHRAFLFSSWSVLLAKIINNFYRLSPSYVWQKFKYFILGIHEDIDS